MPTVDRYAPGTPCWLDLMTTDQAATETFYGQLFGWDVHRAPMDETTHYTMFQQDGRDIAGCGEQPAEMREQRTPSAWSTYLAGDPDAAAARTGAAGGQVLSGPFDVFDQGRMVMLADSTGAVFGVWQAGSHHGSGLVNEPNSVVWNELATPNPDAARAFYERVVDLDSDKMPTDDASDYWLFEVDGNTVGGVYAPPTEMGEVPAHWLAYIAVADTDATVARVTELGGQLLSEPTETPQGRMATLADPQGAVFAVIEVPPPTGD